jgi:hypothetical protein
MAERISCEDCPERQALRPRGALYAGLRIEGESVETNLKGKTVFVTDALHNFGTPTALAFAREGANLFLTTLSDHAQLAHTAGAVSSLGVKVVTGLCDLSSEAQV